MRLRKVAGNVAGLAFELYIRALWPLPSRQKVAHLQWVRRRLPIALLGRWIHSCNHRLAPADSLKLIDGLFGAYLQNPHLYRTRKPDGSNATGTYSSPDMRDALNGALRALEAEGISVFICFGTLLGLVREGAFMAHDGDIDLGVFWPETSASATRAALKKAGYKILVFQRDPWPCRVKAQRTATDPVLDIVFFRRDGDRLQTYTRCYGDLLIRNRSPFGLERAELDGVLVRIPSPPELFLDENYEDWKERSAFHHYILTSPLTDFSRESVQLMLKSLLFIHLVQGNDRQYRGLKHVGMRAIPSDPLWQRLPCPAMSRVES